MSEILTPNKKNKLLDVIRQEIRDVNTKLFSEPLTPERVRELQQSANRLASEIQYFRNKKGVITASEYSKAISIVDEAKKNRMADKAKTSLYVYGIIITGLIISLYLIKKSRVKA
jgi:hypothetical protein